MIVCLCNRVSDRDIRHAVQVRGVRDFEVLKDLTRASSCCGCCQDCAREVFEQACAQAQAHAHERTRPEGGLVARPSCA